MELLVFSPYYPPHVGGLESHADEFNKHLSQKGIGITVFTPRLPEESAESEARYEKVRIIRFPAFEIIPNYPLPKFWSPKFWKLFSGLFHEKYDIVVSRTRFFNTSLLAMFYSKKKRKPWVHIEHGSDFVKSGGKFSVSVAKIYDNTFGKMVIRRADRVVANSHASAVFCKKLVPNIHCKVIYRGVEVEKIITMPVDTELKDKYQGRTIITFLGRLLDGKGVADLILALSKITGKNFLCFIIGDGPDKKRLEKLAGKSGLGDKIIFLGYKNFDEYIKILKISDIFVNPSYTEGLPTTVAEAALCRNAIIATDVGGTREIITDKKSGFLVGPKDVNTLRECLEKLIADEELRKQLSDSAYEEVKNKFSWNNSIEKYINLFSEIIDNKY